jgi:hypothetical protein
METIAAVTGCRHCKDPIGSGVLDFAIDLTGRQRADFIASRECVECFREIGLGEIPDVLKPSEGAARAASHLVERQQIGSIKIKS